VPATLEGSNTGRAVRKLLGRLVSNEITWKEMKPRVAQRRVCVTLRQVFSPYVETAKKIKIKIKNIKNGRRQKRDFPSMN